MKQRTVANRTLNFDHLIKSAIMKLTIPYFHFLHQVIIENIWKCMAIEQSSPMFLALRTGGVGERMVLHKQLASTHAAAFVRVVCTHACHSANSMCMHSPTAGENVCARARQPFPRPGCKPLLAH